MASDRFELRIDDDLASQLDRWAAMNMPRAPRAQVVRRLVLLGLATQPRFSHGERTILAALNDLESRLGSSPTRLGRFVSGLRAGQSWSADLEFADLYGPDVTSREDGEFVLRVLAMWDVMEAAWEEFTEDERAEAMADSAGEAALRQAGGSVQRPLRFGGFHPVREAELVAAAKYLVGEGGRFARFRNRDLGGAGDVVAHLEQGRLRYFEEIEPTLGGRRPTPREFREFTLGRYTPWPQAAAMIAQRQSAST